MRIITPHSDEHYDFIKDLRFELYNEEMRWKMHLFYKAHGMKSLFPLTAENDELNYMVEFDNGYYMITIGKTAPVFHMMQVILYNKEQR